MKEELDKSMKKFDEIWQRVGAREISEPLSLEQERARLAVFIAGARVRLSGYEFCANMVKGSQSVALKSLAEETRSLVRALQLEHYLLTGDIHPRTPVPTEQKGGLAGQRALYLAEERACADYLQAAALCSRGTLRQLYVSQAEACHRRTAALHKIMYGALN